MIDTITKIIEFIKLVVACLGVLPAVVALMKLLEAPGHGAEKKQAVLDLLKEGMLVAEKVTKIDFPNDAVLEFASNAIDLLTKAFNAIGIFRKVTTVPAG